MTESFTTDSNDDCTIRWQYITSLSKDDYTICKATKKKFKRPQISIPPIRKADRSWAKSDLHKAENFVEHLSRIYTTQL
jgi:hypothetical protein